MTILDPTPTRIPVLSRVDGASRVADGASRAATTNGIFHLTEGTTQRNANGLAQSLSEAPRLQRTAARRHEAKKILGSWEPQTVAMFYIS